MLTFAASINPRISGQIRHYLPFTLLIIIAAIWRIHLITLPLDTVSDHYDEGVYTASLQSLAAGHTLYQHVYSAQPPLFLLTLLPFYIVGGKTVIAARFGIVIFSLIGIGAITWLGENLWGYRVGIIAAALFICDPLYLVQSISVQAEVPSIAMSVLALAIATSARFTISTRALLAGMCMAAALLIKLLVIPFIVPLVLLLFCTPEQRKYISLPFKEVLAQLQQVWQRHSEWRRWRIPQQSGLVFFWLAVGMSAVVLLTLLPFTNQLGTVWQQSIGLHVTAAGTNNASRWANFVVLWQSIGEVPLLILSIVVLVFQLRRRDGNSAIILIGIVSCLLLLVLQHPLFTHHVVLISPFAALGAATSIRYFMINSLRTQIISIASISVVIISLAQSVQQDSLRVQNSDMLSNRVISDLHRLTSSDAMIVTDAQIIAVLADRQVPPILVDTSHVRIDAHTLTTAQVIQSMSDPHVQAILWYSGRFHTLPSLNEWVNQHWQLVADYGNGRMLYLRRSDTP